MRTDGPIRRALLLSVGLLVAAVASVLPANATADDHVLVGAGDIAACADASAETARLIEGIAGTVFAAGDNAYSDGTLANYEDCYAPTWGRFRDRSMPVPGNHDWHAPNLGGYRTYFGIDDPVSWYAFDIAQWRVYMLDSDCNFIGGCREGSPEETWLRADLAANPRLCSLAIWHHPRFSSGAEGDHPTVAQLYRDLYRAHADLVIAGHSHLYERFRPLNGSGFFDRTNGIRSFVVGTGGAPLHPAPIVLGHGSEAHARLHGVLKLTLERTSYAWEFVPISGSFHDAGTATCNP